MKILYGVQTTGNGHISRSREVIRELKSLGHEVQVLLSGRKPAMPSDLQDFTPYQAFEGLTFSSNRGRLQYFQTAFSLKFFQFYRDIAAYDVSGFDLVITDFEPLSARIARRKSIPSIGLGHQYAFFHDIPKSGANPLASFVIKNFAPVDYPVGLHWYHFNRPILPPIVPHKIGNGYNGHQQIGNKILVYLPFERLADILTLLHPFDRYEFFIYHRLDQPGENGHIHLRPYSRAGFLKDLVECSGVISNAGFELASESMSLGKKILVKPLAGQMEQLSNALVISSLKMGMAMARLNMASVAKFLDRPTRVPAKIPNVARLVAEWVESGYWEDVEGLAHKVWQQTVLPAEEDKGSLNHQSTIFNLQKEKRNGTESLFGMCPQGHE
jgi:uncharacterized protein (TIGR00661 family)